MGKHFKILTAILLVGVIAHAQTQQTQPQITVADWGAPVIIIRTADDLRELSRRVASNNEAERRNGFAGVTFVLANNIDFTATQGNLWIPIGSSARNFQGTFDGGNSIVRGIVVDNSASIQRGLFGFLGENGIIRNLRVNAEVAEGNALSGLINTNAGGKIENSFVERVQTERPAIAQIQVRQPQITVEDWNANRITIRTMHDLQELARRITSPDVERHRNGFAGVTFTLANDINFSAVQSNAWTTPIGNLRNGFRGIFNGENNVISGIIISNSSDNQNQNSLFGYLGHGGAIRNLGVIAVVREGNPLRALVDVNLGGVIENSYVERINTEEQTQAQLISELREELSTTNKRLATAQAPRPVPVCPPCQKCSNRADRRGHFVFSVRPEFVSNSVMTGNSIAFEFGRITDNNRYLTWEFGGTPFLLANGGGGGTRLNIGVASDLERPVVSVFGISADFYGMNYEVKFVQRGSVIETARGSDIGFGSIFWKLMFGKEGRFDITNRLMLGNRKTPVWNDSVRDIWGNNVGGYSSTVSGTGATYFLGIGYTLTQNRR
ncbi:MAG: hypothetical protein FWE23_08695 [Chitinivibrionia bacterium]|nr:hypothetical protein [Chitinivibrionia bacterium]